MTRARVSLGRRGEALAEARLRTLGYEIVARNFRCAEGELDLIARRAETWRFVEVRTRRGDQFGSPEASITPRKRRHLIAAAQAFLHQHSLHGVAWCIDVVAVELSPRGELLRVDVIENAVTGD